MSVCVLATLMCSADRAEPIEMPFVDPTNHLLDRDQDRTTPFASTRGDKSAMPPFAQLLWTLVIIVTFDNIIEL